MAGKLEILDPDEIIDRMATEVIELSSQVPAKIENDEQFTSLSAFWRAMADKEKEYEAAFDRKKKPVRALLTTLTDEFKGKVKPLQEAMAKLKNLLVSYQVKREAEQRERQQRELEKHDQRVEKAIEKGKDPALVAPAKVVAEPAKTVATDSGNVTFATIKKWRLRADPMVNSDMAKKPDIYRTEELGKQFHDEFWLLDLGKVTKAVKAGVGIPSGVDVFEDKSLR